MPGLSIEDSTSHDGVIIIASDDESAAQNIINHNDDEPIQVERPFKQPRYSCTPDSFVYRKRTFSRQEITDLCSGLRLLYMFAGPEHSTSVRACCSEIGVECHSWDIEIDAKFDLLKVRGKALENKSMQSSSRH